MDAGGSRAKSILASIFFTHKPYPPPPHPEHIPGRHWRGVHGEHVNAHVLHLGRQADGKHGQEGLQYSVGGHASDGCKVPRPAGPAPRCPAWDPGAEDPGAWPRVQGRRTLGPGHGCRGGGPWGLATDAGAWCGTRLPPPAHPEATHLGGCIGHGGGRGHDRRGTGGVHKAAPQLLLQLQVVRGEGVVSGWKHSPCRCGLRDDGLTSRPTDPQGRCGLRDDGLTRRPTDPQEFPYGGARAGTCQAAPEADPCPRTGSPCASGSGG